MLQNAKEMLNKARDGKYAVAHINTNNMEWTKMILETAQETGTPVIIGAGNLPCVFLGGRHAVVGMVNGMMRDLNITVPVALHLDHGSYEACFEYIEAGFSSVMFDGSKYSIEENVQRTKDVVRVAHAAGISVEAEVGGIGGQEDGVISAGELADPEECKLIADLGVDFLAAGIGNIHGVYPPDWKGLDFDVLNKINEATNHLPLVLHGGSGIPDEMVKKAISMGVSKINVNTDCQLAFARTLRTYIEEERDLKGKGFEPRPLMTEALQAIKVVVRDKFEMFGSIGKA